MNDTAIDKALAIARRHAPVRGYADGGAVHAGPVIGETGGREDAIPISVESGAYVIPADVVAACGDGNSLAGMKALEGMFGGSSDMARGGRLGGLGVPGAEVPGAAGAVPIRISHGEFVVPPKQVMKLGRGDMNQGHRALDAFVRQTRAMNVKKLKSLPGPVKG